MQLPFRIPPFLEHHLLEKINLGLLIILYVPLIIYWYDGWLNKSISIEHEYFSHGLIGFPFAAYIIWLNRKKWQTLANQTHPLGGFFLGIGAVFYLTKIADFVNLSLLFILIGICLFLKGFPGLKLQGFPLLLVFLAIPNSVPYLITPYTLPLQEFIASSAAFILMQFGLDVTVDQIYLSVGGRLVEVAPYCAGLKMLFTSVYVALMLLYWTDNLQSRRKISFLLLGAILISVIANIIRNTILTYFHGTGQDALFAWLHEGWGGDLYSAGMLGAIILLLRLIDSSPNNVKVTQNES